MHNVSRGSEANRIARVSGAETWRKGDKCTGYCSAVRRCEPEHYFQCLGCVYRPEGRGSTVYVDYVAEGASVAFGAVAFGAFAFGAVAFGAHFL